MYVDLINIKKQSLELTSTNNQLNSRLEKMNELVIENNRLKELLNFKQDTKMSLVAAQIIGRDLVMDHNTITINKGLKDGLQSGQAVITTGGVLGYIFKPEQFTSHIMLITDRYAVVDGIIQRTRAHGIVEGKTQSSCALKYVERTEDVKTGDIVVTGGLDNIFPKGFPVAIVKNVERKTFSVSLKVDLAPIVDPYKVEEVFVVTDAAKVDFSEKYTPSQEENIQPSPNKKPETQVIANSESHEITNPPATDKNKDNQHNNSALSEKPNHEKTPEKKSASSAKQEEKNL